MMKPTKKLASLLLALVLVLGLSTTAFAADPAYSITVKNTNTSYTINGCTYSAYKIFDATYSGTNVAYTVDEDFEDFAYTVGDKTYKGETLIQYLHGLADNADALDAFAKAALTYIETKTIVADGTAVAATEQAVISLSAPGYYLVTGTGTAPDNQTVTAACALTTAKPTAEITVKADVPSVDKKIVEGSTTVDANTASIGDTVNYKVTSKVPNMKGYTQYYFYLTDTMSKGLTFNNDVAITIDGTALTKDTDYTVTSTTNTDGTTTVEIVFKNFVQYKAQAGKDIVVTYSATVNQDAELDPSIGNPNTVKLTYSNNPNLTGEGVDKPGTDDNEDTLTGTTPESKVNTFVTGLKLVKVDSQGNTLTGAKFSISGTSMKVVLVNEDIYKKSENGTYYMLKDGTYTETAPTEATTDLYDSTTTKYEKVTVVTKQNASEPFMAEGYVDENGVLTFEGLGEGAYIITELVAPDGYNLLKDPITVEITAVEGKDSCTWTVKVKGKTAAEDKLLSIDTDHLYKLEVVNNAGTQLPSTGGVGTTIFYILGGALVLGAAVLLITRKRMGQKD